ncbi:MAG TPA: hypothetical protein VGP99_07970, partial [Tepidisphaeraceae bacterium]|nr:hypothetical protein [Tepidisphaeraceae bacterium]
MQNQISQWVDEAVASTAIYDLHTHLYPANFGRFMLWGIDELLTYHYLIAETIRVSDISYEAFWAMPQKQQAEHIWQKLFIERAPVSEACRGVLTVLKRLGLNVHSKNLDEFRQFFAEQKPAEYVDRVLKLANVHTVVMTNDALDPAERELWLKKTPVDPRFKAVLRIDPVLVGWPKVGDTLNGFSYNVSSDLGTNTMKEIRRFLTDWIDRMSAIYVAVSLTPEFRYPDDSVTTRVLKEAVLPVCRERDLPFAMMIGVQRQVNPLLRLAGDSVGKADITSVDRILAQNPQNKFLVTMLSRENQHELAVTARKHRNMMLFGCWWFMNNPSLIEEITRMRMELLGTSFIPQHSDARILDQVIYKWEHSRQIIGKVLKDKFADIAASGWSVTPEEIGRTTHELFSTNFERFLE